MQKRTKIKDEELIGKQINKVMVLRIDENSVKSKKFICRCDCGKEWSVCKQQLVEDKKIISCMACRNINYLCRFKGNKNGYFKHGESRSTTEYNRWAGMFSRCYSKTNKKYHRYGGRGITVCERWHDYKNFLEDMGRCPKGMSLDRINVEGNYEPSNCRWATQKTQQNNRANNRFATVKGERKSLSEWAKISGISSKVLRQRLDRDKVNPDDLLKPLKVYSRHRIAKSPSATTKWARL